jgi:signal transduction histidine kinase
MSDRSDISTTTAMMTTMTAPWLDRIVPERVRDDPEQQHRGRLVATFALAGAGWGPLFAAFYLVAVGSWVGAAACAAAGALVIAAPWVMRCTGRVAPAGHQLLFALWAVATFTALLRGGFAVSALMWHAAIPLLGLHVVGTRATLAWTCASLAAIAGVYVAADAPLLPTVAFDPASARRIDLLGLTGLVALVASLAAVFERVRRQGLQHVAQRTREVEETLAALTATRADLMESTRLAAIGATTGAAAHEILNPVTGVLARLANMSGRVTDEATEALADLGALRDAWHAAWATGGMDGLTECLMQDVAAGGATVKAVEDDLRVVGEVGAVLTGVLEAARTDLEFCAHETRRIARIVDGMRSLARATREPERASLADLVAECLAILEAQLRKAAVEVDVDVAPDASCVVDRHETVQVLTNLVRNAIQAVAGHRPLEGGHIRIEGARRDDGGVDLRVADNGCGIAPADQARLFERGFTTKRARDGTGLGLAIARSLARRAGGDLFLESSAPGHGATFVVHLPDDPAAAAPLHAQDAPPLVSGRYYSPPPKFCVQ